jgi:hypothetical protein
LHGHGGGYSHHYGLLLELYFLSFLLLGSLVLANGEDKMSSPSIENQITAEKILGQKFDEEKPRWELLPYKEVGEIVSVLTSGAKKYQDNNWKYVTPMKERYFGAMMRHLTAWFNGEKKDFETGISHLAHAGCCLLFLMWGDNNGKLEE